jgi:hypothetical protein
MQLILHYQIADYDSFRRAFEAAAEERGRHGLSLLQLWREDAGNAWALFTVTDAKAAKEWLGGNAQVFNSLAGVAAAKAHFVETA